MLPLYESAGRARSALCFAAAFPMRPRLAAPAESEMLEEDTHGVASPVSAADPHCPDRGSAAVSPVSVFPGDSVDPGPPVAHARAPDCLLRINPLHAAGSAPTGPRGLRGAGVRRSEEH